MQFSLFSLGQEQANTLCYFRMDTDQLVIYSPFYPDTPTAISAMEGLVLKLRGGSIGAAPSRELASGGYTILAFGKRIPAVGKGALVPGKEIADETLQAWKAAAQATTFKLTYWELAQEIAGLTSLEDLDLSQTDRGYEWQEVGSSVLHVEKKDVLGYLPNLGVQANLNRGPCEPIFNALQPFVAADLPLFHGRKKEVEEVYALLKNHSLLLLYGEARVGKTSLLQCGLANRLEEEEEQMIVVRRQESDLLTSLCASLRSTLANYDEVVIPEVEDPILLARLLAEVSGKRIYLIFDQLELFFSSDVFDAERESFFGFIRDWLDEEDCPVRVIMALREAFLAPVAEYEESLPGLLDNRYRLLPFRQNSMIDTTINLLDVFSLTNLIKVDKPKDVAERVCKELANENGDVPVHCLQIYLHQLHQGSCKETTSGPVAMDLGQVEKMGPARSLIDEFITERLDTLKAQRPPENAPPNPALEREIKELEDSRISCGCGDKQLAAAGAAVVVPAPIPWWTILPLAALPFGMFFLYWWMNPAEEPLTTCQLTEQTDSCEAYLNYLCTYGDTAACAPEFAAILEERQCEEWKDYQLITKLATCGAYQQFFTKYRDQGICMDIVRARLLDWECPMVRDTVQLTVRDTVIERVPVTTYSRPPTIPPGLADDLPCKLIGTTNFKRIGPLWVMTEALPGGPYRWEDALDACTSRGWRLPCIGEIDFLIEKIYRNDPARAFAMLTGSGECSLVNPTDQPGGGYIEFWTATEANDASAWSYYFDLTTKTIRSHPATSKSTALPCLCVERSPTQQNSGLPPCYQKNINRRAGQ
ncbi:MAG: hypothetical protein AAGF89_06290 [Bacteroidota bacterium]